MATSAQNRLSEEIKPLINDLMFHDAAAYGTPENNISHRRVLTPGVDYISHANKIGVRLKSATLLQKSMLTRPPTRTALSTRVKSSPHRKIINLPCAQYIQDVVVPIQKTAGREDSHRAAAGLPHMRHSAKSSGRAGTSTSLSLYTEQPASVQPVCHHGNGRSRWNKSEQAARFDMEQEQKAESRRLKRTSEICPHRVDRMYYMSGSAMQTTDRYHVDEEELQQLKELARARKQAKHYGRGLSKYKYLCLQEESNSEIHDPKEKKLIQQGEKNDSIKFHNISTVPHEHSKYHECFLSLYTIELQPQECLTGNSPVNLQYKNNLSNEEMNVSPNIFINRKRDLSLPSPRFSGWLSPRDCDCKHGLEKYQDTYIQGLAVSCPSSISDRSIEL